MSEKNIQPPRQASTTKPRGLKGRLQEITADLQRTRADFANFKRRTEEERVQLAHYAKQETITELLPIIDNLERALSHASEQLKDNDWAKGVEQVSKQLFGQLSKMGVKKIPTVGEEFDPHLHEAVSMDGGTGKKEMIIQEIQAGYTLNDQVIRHAVVKVRKGK